MEWLHGCWLLAACLPYFGWQAAFPERGLSGGRHVDPLPPGVVTRIRAARPGHAAAVTAVAFSPDGSALASASFDEALSLWEPATGKELRRITGHPKLSAIAFSPDGRTLASAGWDGMVRLWRAETGEPVGRLRGKDDRVLALAYSPDGRLLVQADEGATLSLWEAAGGKRIRLFTAPREGTSAVAFSPDGALLATAGYNDDTVQLWEVDTGLPIHRLSNRETSVYCLAFSPDGKSLVTGGGQGKLILWEVATAGERLRVEGGGSTIQCLAFAPDGRTVVTGHDDGHLCAWDLITAGRRCRLPGHRERVRSVAFASTGALLASGSEDMTVLVWRADALTHERLTPKASTRPAPLAALWDDLAADDAGRGYRAVLALAAVADESIPFLQKRARLPENLRARIERLVADLDDDHFAVRRKATDELARLGRQAEALLQRALIKRPSLEAARRIERLLQELPPGDPCILPGHQARILRVVEVLEQIGTPTARQALESLVQGAADTPFRQAVQASLQRLARRPAVAR